MADKKNEYFGLYLYYLYIVFLVFLKSLRPVIGGSGSSTQPLLEIVVLWEHRLLLQSQSYAIQSFVSSSQ